MNIEYILWMGGIKPWMTHEIIRGFFLESGIYPVSIKMMRDHKYNINLEYCFVYFDSETEAKKALTDLNGKKIPGTDIIFKLNWSNRDSESTTNLFIGNLPYKIKELELLNILKKEGINAHHVSIATDNGKSKGYGFIQFNDQDNYYKCLKKMDGYIIKGKAIKVRERQKKNNKDKNCINSHELDNNTLNRYNNYYVNNIDDVNNVNMYYSNNNINNKNSKYDNNNQDSINRENNEDLTEISSLDSNSTKEDNNKKRIVNNLDLLLNNNSNVLDKKIQESIDNMYKKFNNSSKNNEISNILLYYNSK